MFSLINNLFSKNKKSSFCNLYMTQPISPIWMTRDYSQFAKEAYCKNVIANRSMNLVAKNAGSVEWTVNGFNKTLWNNPSPNTSVNMFIENIVQYLAISGNCFILMINDNKQNPKEMHILRPDRVKIISNGKAIPYAYVYKCDNDEKIYYVDQITGKSNILHLKYFNPLDDFYGLSPVESAAYSIDQHNEAAKWNQALLQNGARPSGAIIVENKNMQYGLTDKQYQHLKEQIEENFSGSVNAGKPMLLEGGLKWQEMSISNKDMEFLEAKNSAAREIALAFGVPPQLLGIPGDNTYSNLQEARLALWEETILPLLNYITSSFNYWFSKFFGENNYVITYDQDKISALSSRRESLWQKLETATYLTINEKREILGYAALEK